MARNSADVVDHEVDAMLSADEHEQAEAEALAAINASWFDESERTDVLEPRHLMSQLLPQARASESKSEPASQQRAIVRETELPPAAAEDPRWDDEKEETFAVDFDRLALLDVPDLSESGEWEEAKTAYFERTANLELLDAKFVSEYTDRLPGGLSELVASNVEDAPLERAKPVRKSGVRESARALADAASFNEAQDQSAVKDREHSVHFAYQVSPGNRNVAKPARSLPAPANSVASSRSSRAIAASKPASNRRTGSQTIRDRGRALARPVTEPSDPIDVDRDALDFDEASVATARGGRRFAPTRERASQPAAAPTSSRKPVQPTSQAPRSASTSAQWLASQQQRAQDATHDPETFRALAQSGRPSAQPGALPVPADLESDFAELRAHRRHRAAAWIWYGASAVAAVALIMVVRVWTNTGLSITQAPVDSSVAVETAVNTAQQPADTGFALTSHPEGAQIFVDGRSTGFLTPARVRRLSAGLHSVELKLDGYFDTSLPAALQENAMLELAPVQMRPHPVEAVASAAPVGAIVPPLPAAAHTRAARREARRARHRAITRNARVRRLDDSDRDMTASGEGTLRINSRPWARVLVDNKFVGNTPQRDLKVAVGEHNVKLVNEPLNMSKTFHVTVHDGETVTRVEMLNEDAEQSHVSRADGSTAYARR